MTPQLQKGIRSPLLKSEVGLVPPDSLDDRLRDPDWRHPLLELLPVSTIIAQNEPEIKVEKGTIRLQHQVLQVAISQVQQVGCDTVANV